MFRCDEVARSASRLLDGELGFWTRLKIRVHLVMCRGCRTFVEQMRVTRDISAHAGRTQDEEPGGEILAILAKRRLRSGEES
ncbi:zf-HC2 domain-containing protein [Peteryoungia ipomoeae]|nr:zf-HC2 domain-containing protein [Peteryoungia ipomoeae]